MPKETLRRVLYERDSQSSWAWYHPPKLAYELNERDERDERVRGILFWLDKISDCAIAQQFHTTRQYVNEIRHRLQRRRAA